MNSPFAFSRTSVRLVDLGDPGEIACLENFVADHPQGTPFHRPAWLHAVAGSTGNRAHALVQERRGETIAYLPLNAIRSPIFGNVLASTGFAIGGGLLTTDGADPQAMFAAVEELAARLSCPAVELRGGLLPETGRGWSFRTEAHCNFAGPLADDDEAQLLAIPRKQRAEVRKALANDLMVEIGNSERDRADHYAVFAESYRNLGTPVFPRALLDGVVDAFAGNADILTVRHRGRPIASVITLYHKGAAMPYWGGGSRAARQLRANDRMYYELMLHARRRGCARFDFGRSKTNSGAYHFKRNWGFEPEPLSYAIWTAPGATQREADPASSKLALQIELWKRLPLGVANRVGPLIARGIG
ncbi:MAG TPA: FemAB family XrtA/PEP-CTERM system-associated protein [Novosphingobium sp.]|nr:FemAB family XrtA/PEP-CTERM system-associated protein [Novosphingobium sp.]